MSSSWPGQIEHGFTHVSTSKYAHLYTETPFDIAHSDAGHWNKYYIRESEKHFFFFSAQKLDLYSVIVY